jgi:GNAT superfamily N-acetyltransferase
MRPTTLAAITLAITRMPPQDQPGGGDGAKNTYGLPTGEPIRKELLKWFQKQLAEILGTVSTIGAELTGEFLPLADYDDPMASAMTPILTAYWDEAGQKTLERLGLDPDDWRVSDPHLREKIQQAALSFCRATNETTSDELGSALTRLRAELTKGLVEKGETLDQLRKRVQTVFDRAETWRAQRIAASEASRAVHAAELESAQASGVVAGLEWLVSDDACPLCRRVAAEAPRVKLGEAFAVVGGHPAYSEVRHPPLHPSCQCSVLEVLHPDYGGPADPQWAKTLQQPEAGDDYKPPHGKEPKPRPDAKAEAKPAVKPKPAEPGQPPKYGPSGAKVEADDDAVKAIRAVLGKKATPRDVASIVGAPDDAEVTVRARGDRLEVGLDDPQERYLAFRSIERTGGKVVIHNDAIQVMPEYQGQGLGTAILGRQVEQASRLKADRIEVRAERGPKHVGYHVWPRMGFDGPIPPKLIGQLPAELAGARKLSDLMATQAGRDWWKTHGTTVQVAFDLADGSLSRKLLAAYLTEKRKESGRTAVAAISRAASKRAEEPDLAPGDDALLDAICDRVLAR